MVLFTKLLTVIAGAWGDGKILSMVLFTKLLTSVNQKFTKCGF